MGLRADSRHIAYCDIHSEDNVDFTEILRWQKCYDPHEIILNGDVTLAEAASHWNEKSAFKYLGFDEIGRRLEREFKNTHALLRKIREASPNARIRWVPGNHEAWYYWVALYYPQTGVHLIGKAANTREFRNDMAKAAESRLAPILRTYFKTDDIGVEVLPFHKPLKLGPLTYLHGDQFSSLAATPKYYPNTNLVIGHFHQKKITPLHDSGRRGRAIQHFAVPTLMRLGRGYEKLKASNHGNGFFYANVSRSGLFEGFIKDVFGDSGHLFPWQS